MIIGIGTDLLKLERLKGTYERTSGRIVDKILGPDERLVFESRLARNQSRGIAYLATRFAAKEAFSKAIGLGMRMPMTWRSLQTLNDPTGKPYLKYSGALEQFMTAKDWDGIVTITDEVDVVAAFVIVSQK
jgi:holo-[acyl-carrier protein] synthase